jgi:hypothetical protein
MKNKIILLFVLFVSVNACQSIKDGLVGAKNENSDEFLVKKKNPLELPPDFGSLPKPRENKELISKTDQIDDEIENLFKEEENISISSDSANSNKSAEDFVLKKINKN